MATRCCSCARGRAWRSASARSSTPCWATSPDVSVRAPSSRPPRGSTSRACSWCWPSPSRRSTCWRAWARGPRPQLRARAYFVAGEPAAAEALARILLAQEPRDLRSLVLLAELAAARGDGDQAAERLRAGPGHRSLRCRGALAGRAPGAQVKRSLHAEPTEHAHEGAHAVEGLGAGLAIGDTQMVGLLEEHLERHHRKRIDEPRGDERRVRVDGWCPARRPRIRG